MAFWLAAAFLILTALVLLLKKEDAAQLQGIAMGGRMPPGCAVAEAVFLAVIAIVLVILREGGFFR